MTLNNTYIIQNKLLKELLNEIDNIITNITIFKNKHLGYSYNIKLIITNNNLWNAEINLKHEKQINNKIFKKVS